MNRILVAVAATAFVAACAQVPESKYETPGDRAPTVAATGPMRSSAKLIQRAGAGATAPARAGSYAAAIVKDLVIEEGNLKNLAGGELVDFQLARSEFIALFGEQFRASLQFQRYVDKVVTEGAAGVVVIQPTVISLAAGHNVGTMGGIKPTDMQLTVELTDAATGSPLGSYTVQYGGWLRAGRVPKMDVLRRVFPDAAEQVAKVMAKTP